MMWGYPLHHGLGYGPGYGAGWLGMGFMVLFGLAVTVAIVLFAVWLARASGSQAVRHQPGPVSACEIARVRYAKGEITREQFYDICGPVGTWRPPEGSERT